jgi:hypothetical protein
LRKNFERFAEKLFEKSFSAPFQKLSTLNTSTPQSNRTLTNDRHFSFVLYPIFLLEVGLFSFDGQPQRKMSVK